MLDTLFSGIFDTTATQVITVTDFLLCVGCALVMGFGLSLASMFRSRSSKSFAVTLALLPAVVCVVIMMVNGNVGTGVAVAGAFSLVRFRSVPGTAREISMLFIAMGAGLIAGMGYLGYGFLFTAILCAVTVLCSLFGFGASAGLRKTLSITVPEDLNYSTAFTEVLEQYTSSWELTKVKTTNMGSLFRLTYAVTLRSTHSEKEMIDALRCRNGNLEISLSQQETAVAEL